MFLFCISFVSASVSVANYSVKNSYVPLSNISGEVLLVANHEGYNKSIFFSDNTSMQFGKFLNLNGANFTCFPRDCSMTYLASMGVANKNVDLLLMKPKYLGFVLRGGKIILSNMSFKIKSNFGNSIFPPLSIKFFNDKTWAFDKFSDKFSLKNWGCFNPVDKQSGPLIGDSFYCEMINVQKTDRLKIGADVEGSGGNLTMAVYPENGFGASWQCVFNPQNEDGCIVNSSSSDQFFEGKYQVCVGAKSLTGYNIYEDIAGKSCGFAYNDGPENSTKDYGVFAQGAMFANAGAMGVVNFSGDYVAAANEIISNRYSGNCSSGCILPLRISGIPQNLDVYDVKLVYTDNSEWKSDNLVYDLNKTSAFVDFNGTLDLGFLNFMVSNAGEYSAKLDGEYLFRKNIKILPAPIISSVSPSNPPAGVPITFYTRIDFKGNKSLSYIWEFGDGSDIVVTDVPYVVHSYDGLKNYTLSLNVSAGGNLTSNGKFKVETINPEAAVKVGLKNRIASLEKVKNEISGFPSWYGGAISSALNISNFEDELHRMEIAQNNSVNADDFRKIAVKLYSLDVPAVVSANTFESPFLMSGVEDVNIEPISIISGSVSGATNKEYANPILTWQNENMNVSVKQQKVFASFVSGQEVNILSEFDISVSSNSDEDGYFVINKPFDELYFNGDAGAKKAGDATVIIIPSHAKKNIEFYYKGVDRASFFISPRLGSVIVKADVDTDCNHNGVCEADKGENSVNCRADCKPVKKALWFSLFGFLLFLLAYTGLQVWYKKHYEAYLFKDGSQLYNLLMFVANAKAREMSEDRIAAELRAQGWSSERVSYVIKKSAGKSVGMIEIIPIERVSSWLRNRKARQKIKLAMQVANRVQQQNARGRAQ